jgi:hypothetical protein
MRKITLIFVFLSVSIASFSKQDSLQINKKYTDRYIAWFIPSTANNIYGVAVGLIGSEVICNKPYTKYSHGINIQIIGQGFFLPFGIEKFRFKDFYSQDKDPKTDTMIKRVVHNGILLSIFGTYSNQINGISLSPWMSMNEKVNGLSINLLWNLEGIINGASIGIVNMSAKTNGIQIGIYNKTKKLKGIQLGIWNVNEKRSLPIINWNLKK